MSPERKEPQRNFKVDLKELNKIVFDEKTVLEPAYQDSQKPA